MAATRPAVAPAASAELRGLLLELGAALTMTGDAVSETERMVSAVAAAYGMGSAHVSVLPTLLIVSLGDAEPAALANIDSSRQLRLDQATEVIHLASAAAERALTPAEARARLREILASPPRFGVPARIAAHCALTLGLALLMRRLPSTSGCTSRSARSSARCRSPPRASAAATSCR